MHCQCQILWIRWFDHVSDVEVTACTRLPPITYTIARHRLGLFGHVARMNNGIPVRDALDCALARCTEIRPPDGWKRPPGRPCRVWVPQIDNSSVSTIWHSLQHATGLCPPFDTPYIIRQVATIQRGWRYGPPRSIRSGGRKEGLKMQEASL